MIYFNYLHIFSQAISVRNSIYGANVTMNVKNIAAILLSTAGITCAQTVLVGGEILNGNFNNPAGSGNATFAAEPYWINIGTGNNSAVFLKDDEYFDGTRNAILAESAARIAGLDTGYIIQESDVFGLSYWWRDSFQWNDAADRIKVRLFVTDTDTITGMQSDLVILLSGVSTSDATYEFVEGKSVYAADAAVAGKTLFVALDTQSGDNIANGFARIDNFSLTVSTERRAVIAPNAASNTLHLGWTSLPGNYYSIEQGTNLVDWIAIETNLLAGSNQLAQTLPMDSGPYSFFRITPEPPASFVDPATPRSAQPALAIPTGDTWVLDFSDEFNSFNSEKWVKSVSTSTRSPRPDQGINDWWWKANHVAISNGTLALKISKKDSNTMWCGSIESRNLYETTYGFMEARINCSPIEKGAHTAFWMQGHNQNNVDGSGADGCEVDIFESAYGNGGINAQDNECQSVLHWDGYGASKQQSTKSWNAEDVYTGYHTFALHWTPTYLDFYYDGLKQWTYTGVGIPQVAEWLWLSVGASFGDGNFQTETYPSYSFVDYVRVWKSK